MASINMSIPHQLSQEEALQRIKQMLVTLQQDQKDVIKSVKEDWKDNDGRFEFSAMGFDIAGGIKVKPGSVDIDAKVPMAVSLFKGKIEEIISKKAGELLS